MKCSGCQRPVAAHATICPHCASHLGFPNVRAANDPAELATLQARYDAAYAAARARNAGDVLAQFEVAVQTASRAVIYRPLRTLAHLITSGNGLFQTFYQQVDRGRIPDDSKWDRFRVSVDRLLFPYYCEKIHYAALALDTTGARTYGGHGCALLLNQSIQNRATVFEENSYNYCEKQPITVAVPPGLRAKWPDRHRLAVAKLGHRVTSATTSQDFPGILVVPGTTTGEDQFIEVHIHDPLTEAAVEKALLPKVKSGLTGLRAKAEKRLLKAVQEKLEALGVLCEVV